MSFSVTEVGVPLAERVDVTEDTLTADLSDGRTISVPLAWYPRLVHATPTERRNWAPDRRGRGNPLARSGRGRERRGTAGRACIRRESAVVQALAGSEESDARRERRVSGALSNGHFCALPITIGHHPLCQRPPFDLFAAGQDGRPRPRVDVGRRHVVERLVQPLMVVMLDEAGNRPLQRSRAVT